mmetsp:Transcript_7704/g.11267  ORF Transcript_7704/g.11267 Transcript_7704/m.11267 type:complete len:526 (-) Transcript_7704:45-1622(-)
MLNVLSTLVLLFLPFSLDNTIPFEKVNIHNLRCFNAKETKPGPMALIVERNKDLAEQTHQCFTTFILHLPPLIHSSSFLTCSLLIGGDSSTKQKTKSDIIVATPHLLSKLLKYSKLSPHNIQLFILDEADLLANNDNVPYIHLIYSRLPKPMDVLQRLQVCFFSATLHSKDVRELTKRICHRPLWVDLKGDRFDYETNSKGYVVPETVHHCVISIDPNDGTFGELCYKTDGVHKKGKITFDPTNCASLSQEDAQSEYIKQIKPWVVVSIMNALDMEQVLIFCRTNLDCDLLEDYFIQMGKQENERKGGGGDIVTKDVYSCKVLAGKRSLTERREALQLFKDGSIRILIATDVAARGIDIVELPFVINMTLPDDHNGESRRTYVHRVGRVGRAERMGLAVSLVSCVREKVWFCREGKKPPCDDCRLYDNGGNCKWYNEPKLWSNIEQLLYKNNITFTQINWPFTKNNIPPEIDGIVQSGGYGGLASGQSSNPKLEENMVKISKQIDDLSMIEFELQSEYWNMKKVF